VCYDCPTSCLPGNASQSVCGSDLVSYDSECSMRMKGCYCAERMAEVSGQPSICDPIVHTSCSRFSQSLCSRQCSVKLHFRLLQ
jgi:hypothetical protein